MSLISVDSMHRAGTSYLTYTCERFIHGVALLCSLFTKPTSKDKTCRIPQTAKALLLATSPSANKSPYYTWSAYPNNALESACNISRTYASIFSPTSPHSTSSTSPNTFPSSSTPSRHLFPSSVLSPNCLPLPPIHHPFQNKPFISPVLPTPIHRHLFAAPAVSPPLQYGSGLTRVYPLPLLHPHANIFNFSTPLHQPPLCASQSPRSIPYQVPNRG